MPVPKSVVWVGSALNDLRRFPSDARRRAGYAIYRLQFGEEAPDWKPMTSIGPGVIEVRVQTKRALRIICAVGRPEAIYVLHAFEKKTRRTRLRDIALARQRLRSVLSRNG